MKQVTSFKGEHKEYPDMTLEQLELMVKYLNEGMSEEDARAKVMTNGN